jgi:nucleoside-specific outer membrane channel protein Tsx
MKNNYTQSEHITEIMSLVKIILNQNYFQHNNQTFKQQDGLAMGAPTSAILSEIFIQYLEHNNIQKVLQKHNIIDYYRYVDDILMVYNEKHTNINSTLNDFNKIHPNI